MRIAHFLSAATRDYGIVREKTVPVSTYFGEDTFSFKVMKESYPVIPLCAY